MPNSPSELLEGLSATNVLKNITEQLPKIWGKK